PQRTLFVGLIDSQMSSRFKWVPAFARTTSKSETNSVAAHLGKNDRPNESRHKGESDEKE
ncbi:TPA: hypothetical protein I7686_21000, partial [Vibrio vulnificus]|nr:hypothetical protein [Vibrio vulnificus]